MESLYFRRTFRFDRLPFVNLLIENIILIEKGFYRYDYTIGTLPGEHPLVLIDFGLSSGHMESVMDGVDHSNGTYIVYEWFEFFDNFLVAHMVKRGEKAKFPKKKKFLVKFF